MQPTGTTGLTRQQVIDLLGQRPCRVHLLGVGGSGMSGLARLLHQQGHRVTGCDLTPNGAGQELRQLGVRVLTGHDPLHINGDTDLVVYTSAVGTDHPELEAARRHEVPVIRRGLLLSALMTHQHNIAVAGTHGKTTTTAMIAHVLRRSDSAPTFCVGAPVPVLGSNAQFGGGKYFVAEACESDGTLVGFTPELAVCLNIEPEHLDHYGTMDRLVQAFGAFFASTLGTVFYCADCPTCVSLAPRMRSPISFGLAPTADYRATNIETLPWGSRFGVSCRGQTIGTVELAIPGRQNVVNALAAFAVADQLGVPAEKIAAALREYTGARRRFEKKFAGNGIIVADDYAHHPTEIRATVAAARAVIAQSGGALRRLVVAFQPHRYTRVRDLLEGFATAFGGIDQLFLADIYPASEPPLPGITGELLARRVLASGQGAVVYEPDFGKLAARLADLAEPGDLIMTMGAGHIDQVGMELAGRLAQRGPTVLEPARQPDHLANDLRHLLSDRTQIKPREPLARHTTLRVGGPAELWVEPWDEPDLAALLRYCHGRGLPLTIVGRGSNLLVRDGGIKGLVINLGSEELSKLQVDGERILARAGARLKALVHLARQHDLGGFEFLEGIPGSIGGALRMNAGAMGRQTFELVEWVRYVSLAGDLYDAAATSLPVTYRNCPLFANHVALAAIFRGTKTERQVIDANLQAYAKRRWATQPARPSAGCIFKNPGPIAAGRLIDELGLKGQTIGAARVSEVHGNFIVNEGGATARDILALIEMIRHRARQERGIELETEVMVLGKD